MCKNNRLKNNNLCRLEVEEIRKWCTAKFKILNTAKIQENRNRKIK